VLPVEQVVPQLIGVEILVIHGVLELIETQLQQSEIQVGQVRFGYHANKSIQIISSLLH
jgi:hypothetical protein